MQINCVLCKTTHPNNSAFKEHINTKKHFMAECNLYSPGIINIQFAIYYLNDLRRNFGCRRKWKEYYCRTCDLPVIIKSINSHIISENHKNKFIDFSKIEHQKLWTDWANETDEERKERILKSWNE
mgnify:CR=1 FL=1